MVELPELNDDQRIFLKTIFEHFHKEGKWPNYLWVENTIRRTYPEKWSHFDMEKVSKSLPDGFASIFGLHRNYEQEAFFITPALYYFSEAQEDMADFIRVVHFCVEKVNASDEIRPSITSAEIGSQLEMQPLTLRKIYSMLHLEPDIHDGSNITGDSWRIYLKRGMDGVRRFEGVETFEQYLEKRTGLTHRFSDQAATQSLLYGEGNTIAFSVPFIRTRNQTSWRESITAQLNEFLLLWRFVYGKKTEKLINPFLSELQRKLILIGERLVSILSQNSQDTPEKMVNDVGSIAASLDDLGRMRFFIDGGLSVDKFNALGDLIVKSVEGVIAQLNNEGKPAAHSAPVSLKGYMFQKFVYALLQKSGYKVEQEQRRQNIHVDILVRTPVTSPNGIASEQIWVVEAKYRNLREQIGIDVLRQLSAYIELLKVDKVLLVTNSTLTSEAKGFLLRSHDLEIWDAYKLLAILRQFPELKQDYPDMVSAVEDVIGEDGHNNQHELIQELKAMPTGDGKAYEGLVKRILEFCFRDEFDPFAVKEQVPTDNKKRIRDFIIDNRNPKVHFWQRLIWVRKVEKILFDAKNYKNPVEYKDISDTLRYLKNAAFGNFIIIISRQGIKDYEEVLEDYLEDQRVALFLSDEDLAKMINLKLEGKSPTLLIEDRYYNFLDKK